MQAITEFFSTETMSFYASVWLIRTLWYITKLYALLNVIGVNFWVGGSEILGCPYLTSVRNPADGLFPSTEH